jgi:hypothetical protein
MKDEKANVIRSAITHHCLRKMNFGFRVSFIFNLLCAFSLSSSLGAGLSKQTQKPLGAHQEGILIAMKENTAVFILQTALQTVYHFLRWKI